MHEVYISVSSSTKIIILIQCKSLETYDAYKKARNSLISISFLWQSFKRKHKNVTHCHDSVLLKNTPITYIFMRNFKEHKFVRVWPKKYTFFFIIIYFFWTFTNLKETRKTLNFCYLSSVLGVFLFLSFIYKEKSSEAKIGNDK